MGANTETIGELYRAFQRRDHQSMAALYHRSARFSGPMFGELRGVEVTAMWHMLCERAIDLEVTLSDVTADHEQSVSAHWEARYPFGPKGRIIHNKIGTTFAFEDGKIIDHVDEFNLWRWTRMAFGWAALLTGWSGSVQAKVRERADQSLKRFITDHPEYH